MKKILTIVTIIVVIFGIIFCIMPNKVYAEDLVQEVQREQGSLLKLKENQAKSLEEYKQKYGSDSYGLTAYILHIVQIYSIPFCFLGIIISIIYKVIIGSRHLENAEKGLGMIVAVVTLTIICQVLPLVFALVVKIGRE
ncbi:MAG: hypothetical protein ILA02_02950 [Clostridia bacterium]|nr:hypothetical protein [Clostridia bacterium]